MSVLVQAKTKISKAKERRYILLKLLEWKGEGMTISEFEMWSGLKRKDIVDAIRSLLAWRCLKKSIDENTGLTVYSLNNNGKKLIKVYEEKQGLRWIPSWEQQL